LEKTIDNVREDFKGLESDTEKAISMLKSNRFFNKITFFNIYSPSSG